MYFSYPGEADKDSPWPEEDDDFADEPVPAAQAGPQSAPGKSNKAPSTH